MGWLCDDFVETVKRKAWLSNTSTNYSNDEILAIAFEQANVQLFPMIRSIDDGYYNCTESIPFVIGQDKYKLPARAATQSARDLFLLDSHGKASSFEKVSIGNFYRSRSDQSTGTPVRYAIEGSFIRVSPVPNSADHSILVLYTRRMPTLIMSTDASVVASSTPTTIVTSSAPTWWTSGTKIDVMRNQPDSDLIMQSVAVTNAGSTFTITDGQETTFVEAGDYVSAQDTSPVIPLVDSLCVALGDYTAAAVLRESGKEERAQSIKQQANEYIAQNITSMTPRVLNQPPLMINRNSLLRSGGSYG